MSLFNRPTWAKSQATGEADEPESNIFSHSSRSYRDIIAEQERKKQAKLEKKKVKEERRSSTQYEIKDDLDEHSSHKRRRISIEGDDGNSDDPAYTSELGADVEIANHAAEDSEKAAKRRSPRTNRYVDNGNSRFDSKPQMIAEVVALGDPNEEEDVTVTSIMPRVEAVEEDSDDEFAELARRAREQRQQTEQQAKKSQTPDLTSHSLSPGPATFDTGQDGRPTPPPDPPIQLFITSRIPNTADMIVYRKLSQNIADVRKAWCKRQGFTEERIRDVFFIHRMRRVYDVTTCRSLGLEVDSFGNVTLKRAEGKDDADKVHLEAVDDDIFRQLREEKAREQRKNDVSADSAAKEDQGVAEHPEDESLIRLTLKAKDKQDFRLKVKPTTLFSKIASAYAKTQLTTGQSALLSFDGEQLNPDDEVQNTDISDLDCIEVHITST